VNRLSLALLRVFQRPLPEILRERILGPIGASSDWRWDGYRTSWVRLADGRRVQSVPGGTHWGGGISIHAEDQARIGLFIDSVSGDRTALVSLPLKPIDLGGQTYYEPQRDRIADLLMQWWGVKVGAEDTSVRVIIYNGVGTPGVAGEAAQQLIASGMRVVDTKNADRFDYAATLVVVQDGDLKQGEQVATALGTGEVVDKPSEQDVADVIVIIGKDYVPPQENTQE
jgi:hypothetical protein